MSLSLTHSPNIDRKWPRLVMPTSWEEKTHTYALYY